MKKEIITGVVGLSHYMDDYDDFCRNLVKDSYVFVQYEPNNVFDKDALLVTMEGGRTVGHITRDMSHQIHAGVGNKMVMARVIDGEHKCFHVRMMVDTDAYDRAEISTDVDDIETQLPDGVIGLRNALPMLSADNMMEQAWTKIVCGRECGDDAMVMEGVDMFKENYGCSLCVEDQMRACKICEWGLDVNDEIREIANDFGKKAFVHASLMKQIACMMGTREKDMSDFRERFVNSHSGGESAVQRWLDTVLDGQLKGCYNEMTENMACFVLYHKLSRADIYILLSHLIAITKPEKLHVEVEEDLCTDENEKIKKCIVDRFMKLTPYLKGIDKETFKSKLMDLFDLSKNDIYAEGRKELWNCFTRKFARDDKTEEGFDRIVIGNIVGYLKDEKYLNGNDSEFANMLFGKDLKESDIKNIYRGLGKVERYTDNVKKVLKYYFP